MNNKVLVSILTYNEGDKLKSVINRLDFKSGYSFLIVDDGSTDETSEFLNSIQIPIIKHKSNSGVGAGILSAITYAKNNNFDIIVIMAGNGKMVPDEVIRLTEPIIQNEADYVQGSRYLPEGQSLNLPVFRKISIKLFTIIINILTGSKGTDITCGFRAYRLKILENTEINLNQEWLRNYEMEYYIHYKVMKLGYRIKEVPVSMVYPKGKENYSKIRPIIDWWSMIRPWFYLILKIKK